MNMSKQIPIADFMMYLKGLLISEHKTLHEQVNMQIHYLRVIMPINYALMSSIGKS